MNSQTATYLYSGGFMELKEIDYILTIAECGSISKAADKLLMTQPSLSQFLQQFESSLGCQLFLRTTRGVVLTAAGEAFIEDARKIQSLYREAQTKLRDINDVKGGTVRLGISTFRAQEFLPPILEKFYAMYPDVAVQITELDTIPLETSILEGSLDMGIVAFPLHKLKHDENVEILLNDEVVIAARKGHPISRYLHTDEDGRVWVNFRDAARFEFVLGPVGTRLGRIARQQFSACKKIPITRNDNLTASLALAMARRGLALALTYSSVMSTRNLDFISIGKEGIYLPLALAYPPSSYRSRAAIELSKVIHEVLSEN